MTVKRVVPVIGALALTMLMAGCWDNDKQPGASGTVGPIATVEATAPGAPAVRTGGRPGADGASGPAAACGEITEKVRKYVERPEVAAVEVDAACGTVSLNTTLGDGDSATAVELCRKASDVAYTGVNKAVRVLSSGKKELAVGDAQNGCHAGS